MKIIDSSLEVLTSRIKDIDESKSLNQQLRDSNATLEIEQKAAILEEYINASPNLRVADKKDWARLIVGNWMLWFNVTSLESWKNIWVIKAFDKDANVVFQAYWNKHIFKLGKLTAEWVKRVSA